eukprot:1137790-Pelagomonas_calceolata.AAC.2
MEGTFEELRKQGAPDQSSGAYADVDTTSQMFQVRMKCTPGFCVSGQLPQCKACIRENGDVAHGDRRCCTRRHGAVAQKEGCIA